MHPRQDLTPELLRLAASRAWVLTRTDLLNGGLSRHSVDRLTRSWQRLASGIYALHPPTWHTYLNAGLLLGGPGAAASHQTAAALHGLIDERDLPVRLLVPDERTRGSTSWVRLHRAGNVDRRVLHGLDPPRVGLDDTVVDIAAESDVTDAIAILTKAVQSRRTTADRLLPVVRSRTRIRNRRLIEAALDDAVRGVHSALEAGQIRRVERAHGLPPALRQFPVPETGRCVDGAYPDHRLLLEFDGLRYHDHAADQARDNLHTAYKYGTMRLGWVDVFVRQCQAALLIAIALGFGDVPRRCPLCPTDDVQSARVLAGKVHAIGG